MTQNFIVATHVGDQAIALPDAPPASGGMVLVSQPPVAGQPTEMGWQNAGGGGGGGAGNLPPPTGADRILMTDKTTNMNPYWAQTIDEGRY